MSRTRIKVSHIWSVIQPQSMTIQTIISHLHPPREYRSRGLNSPQPCDLHNYLCRWGVKCNGCESLVFCCHFPQIVLKNDEKRRDTGLGNNQDYSDIVLLVVLFCCWVCYHCFCTGQEEIQAIQMKDIISKHWIKVTSQNAVIRLQGLVV